MDESWTKDAIYMIAEYFNLIYKFCFSLKLSTQHTQHFYNYIQKGTAINTSGKNTNGVWYHQLKLIIVRKLFTINGINFLGVE